MGRARRRSEEGSLRLSDSRSGPYSVGPTASSERRPSSPSPQPVPFSPSGRLSPSVPLPSAGGLRLFERQQPIMPSHLLVSLCPCVCVSLCPRVHGGWVLAPHCSGLDRAECDSESYSRWSSANKFESSKAMQVCAHHGRACSTAQTKNDHAAQSIRHAGDGEGTVTPVPRERLQTGLTMGACVRSLGVAGGGERPYPDIPEARDLQQTSWPRRPPPVCPAARADPNRYNQRERAHALSAECLCSAHRSPLLLCVLAACSPPTPGETLESGTANR